MFMHVFWGFFLIKLGDRVLVRNIRRFHKSQDNVRYLGLARKASDISDYKKIGDKMTLTFVVEKEE